MTEAELKLKRLVPTFEKQNDLVLKAAECLGYRAMLKTLMEPQTVQALREAGVRPFDPDSVKEYKARAERKANRKIKRIAFTLVALFTAVPIILAIALRCPEALTGLMVPAFVLGVAFMQAMDSFGDPLKMFNLYRWDMDEIRHFQGEVPAYALQTALDVKEKLDEAGIQHRFMIDHLTIGRKADPFLVLDVNDTWQWLEVWDEPGFLKERTV